VVAAVAVIIIAFLSPVCVRVRLMSSRPAAHPKSRCHDSGNRTPFKTRRTPIPAGGASGSRGSDFQKRGFLYNPAMTPVTEELRRVAAEFVMPVQVHDELVAGAYRHRGYTREESQSGARSCRLAAWHGIRTHNAIKALHLDELFGSKAGGCVPGAAIEKLPSKFKAVERWDAHRKLGQATAFEAMEAAMRLADEFGVGVVVVDHAFHYLWGGGYVIEAAKRGYVAYTNCTAALTEVVPYGGRFPTLGTNPHSWAFPTMEAVGFPICVDWATSTVAMGRVQQFHREGRKLPPGCAVDAQGRETTEPSQVAALLPFGAHKGYGLALINELWGAYVGGSLPTVRNRPKLGPADEKRSCVFYFEAVRPEAVAVNFTQGRSQAENVQAVIRDILGHGNEGCILPGQPEARAAAESERHGGLLFTAAEIEEFKKMAADAGVPFPAHAIRRVIM
jgi:ureidoglycolate dehydrogenase (NAD+)